MTRQFKFLQQHQTKAVSKSADIIGTKMAKKFENN